jgi:ribosomal protein S27E
MIPMHEPLEVAKCEKCGKIIAEPKRINQNM